MNAVITFAADHWLAILLGTAAWTVASAALAVTLGRMIAAAEHEELELVVSPW